VNAGTADPSAFDGSCLRLISYNIQSGLTTSRYSDYLTRGWQHVVPVPSRMTNLGHIASVIRPYDLVGLQEVDVGSLRSGFIDQSVYLAERAHFPLCFEQTNRRVGQISRHSNVLLSRFRPTVVEDHKLPGVIKGRGALRVRLGGPAADQALDLYVVHMSLSKRARRLQMAYLAGLIRDNHHVVVMGDLNCPSDGRDMHWFRGMTGLDEPPPGLHTYPSWRPSRQLDHILLSRGLRTRKIEVLADRYSDHLPIVVELELPIGLALEVVTWDANHPVERGYVAN
jgi:endonuclease/exonuclease/phosphatase family metal-dependent hydrolase